ncbi:MAG: AtpZ/AtpI family protein [Pseudomonadota bacterium]
MAEDADKQEPPSLDEFSERLDRARGETDGEKPQRVSGAAWGRALRVSTDMLAGLIVGILLGLGLDRLLGTSPWLLLAGIGLGFAAGLRNIGKALKD